MARPLAAARTRPGRFFGAVVGVTAVAYLPLSAIYSPWKWVGIGPFEVQAAFAPQYALYFLLGLAVGAHGCERGLLDPQGMLVRRWPVWVAGSFVAFFLWVIPTALIVKVPGAPVPVLQLIGDLGLVTFAGAACFSMTAVFLRFAAVPWSPIVDTVSENAYGIYFFHYLFALWLQFLLLDLAIPAIGKGCDRIRRHRDIELGGERARQLGAGERAHSADPRRGLVPSAVDCRWPLFRDQVFRLNSPAACGRKTPSTGRKHPMAHGLFVDGVWQSQWYDTAATGGRFVPAEPVFRNWVTPDGSAGPSGEGGFAAERGRYHLYVSLACPYAHRTVIFRKLKELESVISISILDPVMGDQGWEFGTGPGTTADTVNGKRRLGEIYLLADPRYTGRVSVPVLWDKERRTIVNNESPEIIRMLNAAFAALTNDHADYYPTELRAEIDRDQCTRPAAT